MIHGVIELIGSFSMYELVKEEINQRRQEGCIVPDFHPVKISGCAERSHKLYAEKSYSRRQNKQRLLHSVQ